MNKKLAYLLFLPLLFSSLTGCDNSPKSDEPEILLENVLPQAYVGDEYDFSECFVKEEGFTYSIDVYSYDGPNYTENVVETDGLKFTPTSTQPITVVLHASNGDTNLVKTINLGVLDKGDPLEELLISTGLSGYSDEGFYKTLNKSVNYMREGSNNKTSIRVDYEGNQNYWAGGTVFSPNNFRCLEHWKDKTWKNAIFKFWVYNDSDYDLEFALRLKDNSTGTVDIDMTQEGNPSKFAAPHAWTEIIFPLRPLGIDHTLYTDEDGTRNDEFNIKVKYGGVTYHSDMQELILNPVPLHSYCFYLDDIDVVPASDYPGVDTKVADLIDRLISTSWYEDDLERDVNFDERYVKEGESSLHFKFIGQNKNVNGSQGMCLNDTKYLSHWTVGEQWDNVILTFWVYNKSDHNVQVGMFLKDSVRNIAIDWTSPSLNIQNAAPNEWTQIFISLNRFGVNRPLYKNNQVSDEFNIKFGWDNDTNGEFEFYVDGVDIVPASTYPQVNTNPYQPFENGWEDMNRDTGWEKGTITLDEEVFYNDGIHNSTSSRKIVFNAGSSTSNPDFVLSPEEYGCSDETFQLPNFSKGKLDFDVKFSPSILDKTVVLKIVQSGWSDICVDANLDALTDGWYHGSFDFSTYAGASFLTSVIRVGFFFSGVDDSNRSDSFAYLDNIIFTKVID